MVKLGNSIVSLISKCLSVNPTHTVNRFLVRDIKRFKTNNRSQEIFYIDLAVPKNTKRKIGSLDVQKENWTYHFRRKSKKIEKMSNLENVYSRYDRMNHLIVQEEKLDVVSSIRNATFHFMLSVLNINMFIKDYIFLIFCSY